MTEAYCGLVANLLAFTQVFLLLQDPNPDEDFSCLSHLSFVFLRHPVHASVIPICLRSSLLYVLSHSVSRV